MPGSPCLSKIGPVFVPFSFFVSLLARIHVSRRGFEDWRFTGDPAPLVRDNIMKFFKCNILLIYTCAIPKQLILQGGPIKTPLWDRKRTHFCALYTLIKHFLKRKKNGVYNRETKIPSEGWIL